MQARTFFFTCLALISLKSFSQTYVAQVKSPGSKEWFYVNENGEKIIETGYAKGYAFSPEGYAPVFNPVNKEFYFIDLKGKSLITEITGIRLNEFFGLDIEGFSDGMVAVKKGGRWGYLNTDGKLAVLLKYTATTQFNGGYASVKRGKENIIINKKGEETVITDPQILSIGRFSEGLAPFKSPEKKMGFVDTDGKIVIPFKFYSVGYFINGLAWAKTFDKKVGFINKKGEWVIEPKFLAAGDFDDLSGFARIKKDNDRFAYVNRKGEIIEMNDTETLSEFSEGLAYGRRGDKVGFYDANGKWVIEAQFEAVRPFKNGFAAAKKGELWGLIDKKGKWVINPNYVGIRDVVKIER